MDDVSPEMKRIYYIDGKGASDEYPERIQNENIGIYDVRIRISAAKQN